MAWKITADVIVVVHFLWILFIICGALIGRWVRWVKWLHVGALAFSVCLQLFQWTCPLTYLEVWLRQRHDPALGYVGDFLAHYAERLVYLPAPRGVVFAVTLLVVGVTVWAYWPRSQRD
ncbi:DUF2784 domain-containing protein [Nitrospiraceae bacterium AH_259_D15_M11_P09]|nr:DUF2784 domain-containing protein [Nitrospiraceae bacterium AH_259_D15_M11_P09]